jgi:TetR/AcrR family transcriptional repressor of multidrug resistance operon
MRTRDEQKETLVKEKAIELLVKNGFDGFSMQKLAKEASISPATLYIYYTDRDDLIQQLGAELGTKFADKTMEGFSGTMSLAEGLRKQWENRAKYMLEHPMDVSAYEVIRNSPAGANIAQIATAKISPVMAEFARNAVNNGELRPMPIEVYWAVAYGPLYSLLKFHLDGKSIASKPFSFTDETMYYTLELVLKALKP